MMTFLNILFLTVPIIALFSGLALVPLLIIVVFIVVILLFQYQIFLFTLPKLKYYFFLFVALAAYVLLSILLSEGALGSLKNALKILLIWCSGFFVLSLSIKKQEKFITSYGRYFILGFALAVMVALCDIYTDGFFTKAFRFYKDAYEYSPSELNRGAVYLSLCLWPLLAHLQSQKQYAYAAFATLVSVLAVFQLESLTASVALVIALIAFALCAFFKDHFIGLITVVMIGGVALTPFIVAKSNPTLLASHQFENMENSIKHRLFIWDFVAKKAMEKPLLGWGFDSARSLPIGEDDKIPDCWGSNVIKRSCQWTEKTRPHILPLHPHNGTLQIWLELGVVGLIFYMLIIGYTGFRIANSEMDPLKKYAFFALFVQFIVLQQTGFGIWQNWLWAAGILVLIQLKIATTPPRSSA